MKKILICLMCIIPVICGAQFSINGQGSFIHFSGGTGLKHFGAGLRLEYTSTEWVGAYGGVNFYLSENYQAEVKAYALSGNTDPQEIEIPTDSEVSFTDVFIGGKVYFLNRYEMDDHKPWGLYLLVEGGLLFGSATSNIPVYDEELYWSPVDDEVAGTFVNYVAGLGLGLEYFMGKSNIYFDFKSRATVDEANRQLVRTPVPFGFSYNVGFRYPFDFSF